MPTLHSYDVCLVLLEAITETLKLRMSDLETRHSKSGQSAWVSGHMTNGHYLCVRIVIERNMPLESGTFGNDKESTPSPCV